MPQCHELSLALAHGYALATAEQAHELDQARLEAITRLTHRHQRAAHARHIAMVIRAEHINQACEAAFALAQVIGEIRCEIRTLAIGADQHTVLVIAVAAGAEPHGPVLAIELAPCLELIERVLDRAAAHQLTLGIPTVELDAEGRQILADVGQHSRQ